MEKYIIIELTNSSSEDKYYCHFPVSMLQDIREKYISFLREDENIRALTVDIDNPIFLKTVKNFPVCSSYMYSNKEAKDFGILEEVYEDMTNTILKIHDNCCFLDVDFYKGDDEGMGDVENFILDSGALYFPEK